MTEITPTPSDSPEPAGSLNNLLETDTSSKEDPSIEAIPEENLAKAPRFPAQLWGALILVAFAFGLGAGYLIWARPLAAAEEKAAAAEQRAATAEEKVAAVEQEKAAERTGESAAAAEQEVRRYPVPVDDDYVLGLDDAEITIIEFSDYECPYCQRWHQEAWPAIKEKYGDKVRLVYRDFPLESIHPNAVPAAEAANCAGEQKKYYEFNSLLFNGGESLSAKTYEAYAQQIGLDLNSFKECTAERRYQSEVQDDIAYASELGVRSTPTFFINGLALVGAQPFDVFEQIIDMELAGEIPQ